MRSLVPCQSFGLLRLQEVTMRGKLALKFCKEMRKYYGHVNNNKLQFSYQNNRCAKNQMALRTRSSADVHHIRESNRSSFVKVIPGAIRFVKT